MEKKCDNKEKTRRGKEKTGIRRRTERGENGEREMGQEKRKWRNSTRVKEREIERWMI